MRRDWFFLLMLICLGAALRLDLLVANRFVIDSDEAIVGLMAKHIAEGEAFPTFYYGQHYMGSLEAICVAVLFWVFGASTIALKLVPFCFSLILILVVYELAYQVANKLTARISALLCAIPPSALVIWSSMSRGGFIEIVVIGALSLLLLQNWLTANKISLKLVAATGFVLGVGWWVNNQILYFMLPVAVIMLGRILWLYQTPLSGRLLILSKVAVIGLLSWLVGGAPYWIYNIKNDWASLGMFKPAEFSDIPDYFQGFYDIALPILLGGSRFWQGHDIYPGSKTIISLIYSLLLAVFLFLRRKQLASLLLLRVDTKSCLEVFFILLLSCIAIFVSSSFGWLSQAPRYLLPMYVGIFIISGFTLASIFQRSRIVGAILLSLILLSNLASSYWGGRTVPGEPIVFRGDRVSKDHSEIIKWLKDNKVSWVRTNYWIGYRLAFETNEEVKFLVSQEPNQTRIEDWPKQAAALEIDEMPLVMVPSQARFIREALKILHFKFEEEVLSGYHVFHDIEALHSDLFKIDSSDISVSSDLNANMTSQVIDGSIETRWGSGKAQSPGMQLIINLKHPTILKAMTYDMGKWPQDFPRGLQVEFERANGERVLYFDSRGWESLHYLLEMRTKISLYVANEEVSKVIFTQTGKHPIFDWSVAEISLYK